MSTAKVRSRPSVGLANERVEHAVCPRQSVDREFAARCTQARVRPAGHLCLEHRGALPTNAHTSMRSCWGDSRPASASPRPSSLHPSDSRRVPRGPGSSTAPGSSKAADQRIGEGRIASAPRREYGEAIAVVLTTSGHKDQAYELSGDTAWSFTEFAQA